MTRNESGWLREGERWYEMRYMAGAAHTKKKRDKEEKKVEKV